MKRCFTPLLGVMLLSLTTVWSGCKEAEAPEKIPANPAPEGAPAADAGASSDAKEAVADMPAAETSAVSAELAKLPEEERAVVAAQKLCPVSGEALGSMGAPIKVTVGGKDLYVCCESCVDPVKKEFDKYLAVAEDAKATAAN